jgi:MraZ protein
MTVESFEQFKENIEASLANSTFSYEEFEAFQYQFVAPAQITEIDAKSGRIPVPAAIRSYAKLSRNCLVLSIEGHLEIWDADSYRSYMEEIQRTTREAAKKLGSVRLFGKNPGGGGRV